jgi:RNA polymerase sigma factor (sigma-70 family)
MPARSFVSLFVETEKLRGGWDETLGRGRWRLRVASQLTSRRAPVSREREYDSRAAAGNRRWKLSLTFIIARRCRYIWVMSNPSILAARTPASGRSLSLGLFGDERLARLVGKGSERAFAAIYERYHQRLYRYCGAILHDDQDAQDALQSTLALAFAALQRGQRDAPLRPWLFRIAHNEAISVIRRRSGAARLSETRERAGPSAAEQAGERARLALLVEDMQQLPERQRGALVMRELSGLSHEQIAIALGTSVGAAKQSIFEARQALLEFGEGRSMACEDIRRTVSEGDGRALRGRRVRAHLRDCTACAAFASAIPARKADLHCLSSPLPPALATGLLARLCGLGSGHGAGGAGGMAVGVAGKTVGATLAAKALAGAVIVVTAAGVTGGVILATHDAHRPAVGRPARTTLPAPRRIQREAGAPTSPSRIGAQADLRRAGATSAIPNTHSSSSGGAFGDHGAAGVHRGAEGRAPARVRRAEGAGRRRSGTPHRSARPGGQPPRSTPTRGASQPSTKGGRVGASPTSGKPEDPYADIVPGANATSSTPAAVVPALPPAQPSAPTGNRP